ncbi:MAG: PQQ-binding-like beta-propeller repeat protein [Fimbriimonadia bacterium]|jgi:hypothetical protein
MKALACILLSLTVPLALGQVWPQPDEWPMLTGDASGSCYTRVPPIGVTSQVWRTNLSSIRTEMITWRQAVAAHGRLYLKSKDTVAALDATSGMILWSRPLAANEIAAAGKGVVMALSDSGLIALDGRTGERLWDVTVPETTPTPRLIPGYDFALVVGSGDGGHVARFFDTKNGETLSWNSALRIRATGQWSLFNHPSAIPASGSSVVCFSNREPQVVFLPTSTSKQPGALACSKNLVVAGWADTSTTMVPMGDELATQTWSVEEDGSLVSRWVKTGKAPTEWGRADKLCIASPSFAVGYSADTGQMFAFNPTTGAEHWKGKKGWPLLAMVAGGQRVYAAFQIPSKTGGGPMGTQLQVLDLATGETLLRHDLPALSVNALVPAYRKLYVLGHHNPAALKPDVPPAAIPVVVCLGNP